MSSWEGINQVFGLWGSGYAGNEVGPDEDGWKPYIGAHPPRGVLLQFETRVAPDERRNRTLGYVEGLHPLTHVGNLYWRLTGIGREQMEGQRDRSRAAT